MCGRERLRYSDQPVYLPRMFLLLSNELYKPLYQPLDLSNNRTKSLKDKGLFRLLGLFVGLRPLLLLTFRLSRYRQG